MKYVLSVGLILIGVGFVVVFATFAFAGFNFDKVSITQDDLSINNLVQNQGDFEQKTAAIESTGQDIVVDVTVGAITIGKSIDSDIHIAYYDSDSEKYKVNNSDDTLEITKDYGKDIFSWRENFNFDMIFNFSLGYDFDANQERFILEILVPENFNGDITLSSTACDVDFNGITAGDINLNITNGVIDAQDLSAIVLDAQMTNGEVKLDDTTLETLRVNSINGAIKVDNVTASYIDFETVNGIIEGDLVGDISEYTVTSSVFLGSTGLPGSFVGTTDKTLRVKTVNGSIDIKME